MRCVGFTLSGSSPEAVALTICTFGISQMADYPITTQPLISVFAGMGFYSHDAISTHNITGG
jgi:hypothetical protein